MMMVWGQEGAEVDDIQKIQKRKSQDKTKTTQDKQSH
jgi:hypothetical protein